MTAAGIFPATDDSQALGKFLPCLAVFFRAHKPSIPSTQCTFVEGNPWKHTANPEILEQALENPFFTVEKDLDQDKSACQKVLAL